MFLSGHKKSRMSVELKRLYKTLRKLGSGADGSVYEVQSRSSGVKYAMKVVKMESISAEEMFTSEFPLEAKLMVDLSGVEGVVQLEHVFREKPMMYGAVRNADSFVLVMAMPETSAKVLSVVRLRSKSNARVVFSRLAAIVGRVDAHGISHMDLHSGNVLVEEKSLGVTLIDFGRAQYKSRAYGYVDALRRWEESPPELIGEGLFDYDRCTVWYMAKMMYDKYQPDARKFPELSARVFPPLLLSLLARVFVPWQTRIGLREMLAHPYFDLRVPESYAAVGDAL